jgi:hypothetical protein
MLDEGADVFGELVGDLGRPVEIHGHDVQGRPVATRSRGTEAYATLPPKCSRTSATARPRKSLTRVLISPIRGHRHGLSVVCPDEQ